MAAQEYYNHSPQAIPGPGILKRTAEYPTSTYHQQAQNDIAMSERSAYPTPAVYNPQNYSQQQPYYPPPPPPQAMDYNSTQPPAYGYQPPPQQPHQRDGRHQYQAVEPHSYRNLPPHLRPRRSISEPPDPHYLAQHIPGYHHRGRSTSSSYSSSPERSRSRSRNRAHSHSRTRSTRSMSRSRHRQSHTHSRASKTRARNTHKDRNTFFGAFGGGLIGDLIMPGLGTLGGAILGGVGGREVSRSGRKNEKGEKPERRRIFGGKTYEEEWREGRIARGEISG